MGLRTPVWFGIGLSAALFFLWCLVSAMETEINGGWTWGLVISGLIGIVALAMAAVGFWGTGASRTDPLLRTGTSDRLRDQKATPRFTSEVPRSTSGRSLT
ncbi:hypothetical protein N9L47_11075 [Rhodobacteraceae bacterium]|nr:hypothetical protein [Paracoccaceae bacterium]